MISRNFLIDGLICGIACVETGPGYESPMWAFKHGPREKILHVVTVQPDLEDEKGDYLSVVDGKKQLQGDAIN
jgi:hypothetical protein